MRSRRQRAYRHRRGGAAARGAACGGAGQPDRGGFCARRGIPGRNISRLPCSRDLAAMGLEVARRFRGGGRTALPSLSQCRGMLFSFLGGYADEGGLRTGEGFLGAALLSKRGSARGRCRCASPSRQSWVDLRPSLSVAEILNNPICRRPPPSPLPSWCSYRPAPLVLPLAHPLPVLHPIARASLSHLVRIRALQLGCELLISFVVCIAHVTNAMGKGEGDFAKGGGLRRENRPATRRRVRKAVRGAVKQPDCPRAVMGRGGTPPTRAATQ
jgi:hypothetical protein